MSCCIHGSYLGLLYIQHVQHAQLSKSVVNLDEIYQLINAVCHVFYFPINARGRSLSSCIQLDVKPQPVKTCSAATELHNTEPIACASFLISTYRLVLLVLNVQTE